MKPKLAMLTIAMLLVAGIATAVADEDAFQAALSRLPDPAPGEPFPGIEVIDMATACAGEDAVRYYPPEALRRRIPGDVVLDCAIGADGKLTTCQVLYAEPARYRFGAAAVRIACQMRADPAAIQDGGEITQGNLPRGSRSWRRDDGPWHTRIPVRFRLR